MAGGTMLKARATAIALTGALTVFAFLPMAHSAAAGSGLVSDEFNGSSLDSAHWTVQNPVGDGSVSETGGELHLTVPSGHQHDLWPGSEGAVRVLQPVSNGNFEVETKFDSMGTGQYQDQGIVVQQNTSTLLRFDVYSQGSGVTVFAASINGTTPTTKISEMVDNATQPFWLRVKRTGSTWLFSYSKNGTSWAAAGTFNDPITVNQVGLYVGNSGAAPLGWTSNVDYFRSIVSTPINIAGDQFNAASLNTGIWHFVDPAGDSDVTMNGSHALITAPDGSDTITHDPNTVGDGSPRLMQSVTNGDFSFDAKFDSEVTQQFQEQGVIVQQDATHYLHAELIRLEYGTALRVYDVDGGTITPIAAPDPPNFTDTSINVYNRPSITLRLTRTGDGWALGYSYDGTHWTAATAFIQPMTVTEVGVFGGNQGNTGPQFTASIDSVLNTAVSTAKPAINVWYGANQTFGAKGVPQKWVNIVGDVSDPVGLASLTYSINGGMSHGLSLGENDVRLVAPGEFNAEIDNASLRTGVNSVIFTAIDNDGNQQTSLVHVTKVVGKIWPLPYSINWSQSGGLVNNVAQVADGNWAVQGNTARNLDIGYDRLITIGQASAWGEYEVTAQATIHSLDPGGSVMGIITGFQGATSDLHGMETPDQPRIGHPFPAGFFYGNDPGQPTQATLYTNTDAHPEEVLTSDPGTHLNLGVTYTFKARVTDNSIGGSLLQFKIWQTGTPEPTNWLLEHDAERSRGSVVLAVHRADVSFGAVNIVGFGPADAPTIGTATPGVASAAVAFAGSWNSGGHVVTAFTATCVSSNGGVARSASASASPIHVAGLTNGRSYRCAVTAWNGIGTSVASGPTMAFTPTAVVVTGSGSGSGYWMLDNTGRVYPFGSAQNFGSAGGGAVAIAARKDGKGYWTTDAFGTVHGFGAAHADAGRPALRAGELVATISATPSGGGYWLFTNQGRALAHGDARFFGDMSNVHLNGPIVSSVATPTGHGYYMVGSDGGVFSFGDAAFHGSTGNIHLNRPVVGLSPTPDNKGYWLVASDGGVFAFTAPFRGSLGAVHLNQPVNGIISFGNGYLMVASDGGVFDFSNKAFVGSLGGRPAGSASVVGIVAAP